MTLLDHSIHGFAMTGHIWQNAERGVMLWELLLEDAAFAMQRKLQR
jgi:hypothetical protein